MGIKLHVAWRDKPTRRGFSLIDSQGERAITVIGERLAPTHKAVSYTHLTLPTICSV